MEVTTDYYEILEVERDADARTIKRAFLKKARQLHPDVSDDPEAEEKFKQVNEAYSVLSDEQRRANYDRYGNPDGPSGFGGFGADDIFSGFGMDDIFSSFFGGGQRRSRSGAKPSTRGRDMAISLTISLEEAASGCTKTLKYNRLAPCDECMGSGRAEGGSVKTCDTCHGTGRVVSVKQTILGQMQTQTTCPDCGGSGSVVENPCPVCEGQGRVPSREEIKVDIPAGIHNGQQIRLNAKGEAGLRGDDAGSLIVTIEIAAHERFKRQGDDLYCVQQINCFDALVGNTYTIEGILADEKVELDIPAGTQYGDQIVIEKAGMPRYGSESRGRMVVACDIQIPTTLTKDEKQTISLMRDSRFAGVVAEDEDETTGFGRKKKKSRPRKKKKTNKK